MRLNSWFRLALLAGVAFSLAGCSYIAGLFPDKQKQYRYSSELPDLEIPPDLVGSKISGKAAREDKLEPVDSGAASAKSGESSSPPPAAKKRKPAAKHNDSNVTLADSSDNAALIELSEPYAAAWNDVGRALGRLKIEITDQNRQDGVYYVYYGGEPPKKPEETGFWDDVKAVFSIEKDKAKEYRVKLEDKDDFTFIRVYEQDGDKGVSEGKGLELLKRIHKKLTTLDQPEPEGEEGKKAAEDEKKETEKPAAEKP